MKTAVWCVALCLLAGLGTAQGQDLRIDFSQTGGPVEADYQAYRADHEVAATFTAQSFAAFGTTVTLLPTWASGATAAAMQMILRGDDDDTESPDLIRDWIGTDGRQPGDPMTLTISGLPAGTYKWVSLHHDPQDQTGVFDVTVNDAAGSTTTTGIDISDFTPSGVLLLADMTKFTTMILSNGVDPVTLVFTRTSPTDPVATAFFVMNSFELTAESTGDAMLPTPPNGAVDVLRDGTVLSWAPGQGAVAHDVYLGTDYDDIDDGMTTSSVYLGRQDANSFDTGRLAFGQTYYWRVDEVTSDDTITKGAVWSFTVEPVSIPVPAASIVVTASSSDSVGQGPEKTIDGSGLSPEDLHGVDTTTMWLSAADSNAAWIQYQFDRPYKLHQMLVWNHNTAVESFVGLGAKDVTIEYSLDGATWTMLDTVHEFPWAPGAADYAAGATVDFVGAAAQYVRITISTNWGDMFPRFGLSEVRFMAIPVLAREPVPAVDAIGVDPRMSLSWRAGRDAVSHQAYLSEDVNDVVDGTALVGTASGPEFDAGSLLALGKTYYWKVNEVNDAEEPAVWEGEVWSFTTADSLPVDDMESYDDNLGKGNCIFDIWLDGWDVDGNGAQVGHTDAPFAEKTIVHGGAQSMPLYYDGTTEGTSEATRTFDEAQDWTQFDVKGLTLWFFGDSANTAGQMYVKVNNSKVTYDGDAENLLRKPWQRWYIPLTSFTGVDLKKVTTLTLGLEGGVGVLYIDDIGLSAKERELVTPVQPGATDLVAQYSFEGNANDSAGTRHGTVTGAPQYVAGKVGQAIKLDGARDYVHVESSFELPVYSVAAWFRVEGGSAERDVVSIYNSAGNHGILIEVRPNNGLRFLHRAPVGSTTGSDLSSNFTYTDGAWHHATIVKSADTVTGYIDGVPVVSSADTLQLDQSLPEVAIGVLKDDNLSRFFPGAIDEVCIYSRVLSEAEIAWLAGRTQPFDKP